MALKVSGVVVRANNENYAMHSRCADNLIDLLIEDGLSVMDANIPAKIIEPLFAEESEWTCAHTGCLESLLTR